MTDQIEIVKFQDPSDYEGYGAIRQDLSEINTDSQSIAREIIELVHSEALEGAPVAFAGVHAYNRKGYLSLDPLGGSRNPHYSSRTDDVILQITVRVDYAKAQKIVAAVGEERIAREEAKAAAKRAEIDEQIARLQAQREAL